MIDASSFANLHNAFWAEHTPTLEHFVRRLNLEYTERWSPPIEKPEKPIRAAFVSEFAFALFCGKTDGIAPSKLSKLAIAETKKRLLPLIDNKASLDMRFTKAEQDQIRRLEAGLTNFFNSRKTTLHTRPLFKGCGYIDASEADVISDDCLFEIKTVDRQFRGTDIRQLATYYALNHASKQHKLSSIGIFNPRRSLWFQMNFDEVSREISGRSAQELCDSIVLGISSGEISR